MIVALCVNFLAIYYFWRLQNGLSESGIQFSGDINNKNNVLGHRSSPESGEAEEKFDGGRSEEEEIRKSVTIVLREFEFFENDITETLQSFIRLVPSVRICLLADAYPYPPLPMEQKSGRNNVQLVVLHPKIDDHPHASHPEHHIHTPYVLLVPDSVRLTSLTQMTKMLSYAKHHGDQMVAAKVAGERSRCSKLTVRLREWTLESSEESTGTQLCDGLQGTHVVLMRARNLFNLSQPFARPYPYALFVQTSVKNWKAHILESVVFQQGRPLFLDAHSKWKHGNAHKERLKMLYEDFGVKRVVLGSGSVEWHGCTKSTPRCFGTVFNDMPEYLFAGRWTPPCCLEGLRLTARRVFAVFKECGVRYWLEGGSLLGAVRSGDIIPWDYDVDVGMYEEDVVKCPLLDKAGKQASVTDQEGFVWEKAREGDFYRVQFSQVNHLHVDIFPFFSRKGIMTKKTWFKSHRQDKEFPEHYLRPLTTIRFVGVEASAPNNINEFLELKFGEGVIANPQYPNPKLLKFPNNTITRL